MRPHGYLNSRDWEMSGYRPLDTFLGGRQDRPELAANYVLMAWADKVLVGLGMVRVSMPKMLSPDDPIPRLHVYMRQNGVILQPWTSMSEVSMAGYYFSSADDAEMFKVLIAQCALRE